MPNVTLKNNTLPLYATKTRIKEKEKCKIKYSVGFKTANDQSAFLPLSLRSLRHLQTSTGSDLLFALSCLHGLAF